MINLPARRIPFSSLRSPHSPLGPAIRRIAQLATVTSILMVVAGCSILPDSPPVQRLDPRIEVNAGAHGSASDSSLGLPRPEADPARDSNRVLVRTGSGRIQVLSGLRWVAPAPDLVQTALIRYLRDAEAFEEVLPSASLAERALFIDLRRFEVAETDDGLRVVIELDARVLDAISGQPEDRFRLLHDAPLGGVGAAEVVAGFEAGLSDIATRIGEALVTP